MGEKAEDFVDGMESTITSAVPQRLRHRRSPRQNTVVNVTWRALVLIVGLLLLAVGVALLVLPGPGWATIVLGLAVLASEYTWANRLLQPVRRRVRLEASRVRGMSRKRQVAVFVAFGTGAVMFMVWSVWMLSRSGVSLLPW